MALINRRSYVDLLQAGAIDVALSPALISIGKLLAHVRRGDVAAVHTCRKGAAEAIELVAHGDRKSSKVVGRAIRDLPVIEGAHIACIVRQAKPAAGVRPHGAPPPEDQEVVIPRPDTVIESDDHVIVFLVSKRLIPKVEKLFQVAPGYI
jgi:trk system potassium uptake protein TrkA